MAGERNLLEYEDPELIAALEHHLRRKGWKQAELSRRTGINTSTISDWLNGRYGPGAEALRAACQAFGVSRSRFWGTGERIVDELRKEQRAEELAGLEQRGDAAEFAAALLRLAPETVDEVVRLVGSRATRESAAEGS